MNLRPGSRLRVASAIGAAAIGVAVVLTARSAQAAPVADGQALGTDSPNAIAGSYIVAFKDKAMSPSSVGVTAASLARQHGGTVVATYSSALRGFSARMSEAAARRLAAHPEVAYVEQDQMCLITDAQTNPPSWGLNRIDQRDLPLNTTYMYPNTASNVPRTSSTPASGLANDFGAGRPRPTRSTTTTTDCNGHGTHVAGTVGGTVRSGQAGPLVGVRVLNCAGSGTTTEVVRGGLGHRERDQAGGGEHGSRRRRQHHAGQRGGQLDPLRGHLRGRGRTTPSTPATYSPARAAAAITVGATQSNDARASYSNFGTCWTSSPRASITSAWYTSNTRPTRSAVPRWPRRTWPAWRP